MAISNTTQVGSSWEALLDAANTSPNKAVYEEALRISPNVRAGEIFGESIPVLTTALANGATEGVLRKVRMALTLDNSVGRTAWVAVNPWAAGWSSGNYDPATIMRRWLSKKDGDLFMPRYFGGANGATEIPPLDDSSPVFYPTAGLLAFESARSELGTAQTNSIWLEAYYYEGKMLSEMIGYSSPIDADFVATCHAAKL